MTLPIIIISTITGTANFAHETFPVDWQSYVPLVIGGFNIIGGILTTIMQFLKVNELMEAHRVTSIQYGKLYRNIDLELSLPYGDRSHDGSGMIDICKTDYDRLIEQSPSVPGDVLRDFEKKFQYPNFQKPDISDIVKINTFKATDKKESIPEPSSSLPNSIRVNNGEEEVFHEVIELSDRNPDGDVND